MMVNSGVPGSWITWASLPWLRVLTFYMNGSVVGNGEVVTTKKENLLFPKNLEDAGSDALNYDELVVAVDFVSPCTRNQVWFSYTVHWKLGLFAFEMPLEMFITNSLWKWTFSHIHIYMFTVFNLRILILVLFPSIWGLLFVPI